jgi:hypothetical protein
MPTFLAINVGTVPLLTDINLIYKIITTRHKELVNIFLAKFITPFHATRPLQFTKIVKNHNSCLKSSEEKIITAKNNKDKSNIEKY